MTDTITTPDGVTLKVEEYREGDYVARFPEAVEYRGWDITFADYNKDRWQVIGDLREAGDSDNHDRAAKVERAAREAGIEVEGDHESAQAYFALESLADAKRLVDLIEGGSGQFALKIELGSNAMRFREEVAAALSRVAEELIDKDEGIVRDRNGNTVGTYKLEGHDG